jgi:DNA-binding CsgD family transcriptional regulator
MVRIEPDLLSAREAEVVELLAAGLTNREVAVRLTVEVSTVNSHVHRALQKVGCANRVELARWWHDQKQAADPSGVAGEIAVHRRKENRAAADWLLPVAVLVAVLFVGGGIVWLALSPGAPTAPPIGEHGVPGPTATPPWTSAIEPSLGDAGILPTPYPLFELQPPTFAGHTVAWRTRSYHMNVDAPQTLRGHETITETWMRIPQSGVPSQQTTRHATPGGSFGLSTTVFREGCSPGGDDQPAEMLTRVGLDFVDLSALWREGFRPGGTFEVEPPAAPDGNPKPLHTVSAGTGDIETWHLRQSLEPGLVRYATVTFHSASGLLVGWRNRTVDEHGAVVAEHYSIHSDVYLYDQSLEIASLPGFVGNDCSY